MGRFRFSMLLISMCSMTTEIRSIGRILQFCSECDTEPHENQPFSQPQRFDGVELTIYLLLRTSTSVLVCTPNTMMAKYLSEEPVPKRTKGVLSPSASDINCSTNKPQLNIGSDLRATALIKTFTKKDSLCLSSLLMFRFYYSRLRVFFSASCNRFI